MARVHDRGGWPTDQPIDTSGHVLADWERQTHALMRVLSEKGLMVTDEMRRGIEAIPAEQYESLSYYERWAASIESILVEKNLLTTEEIDQRTGSLERRWG